MLKPSHRRRWLPVRATAEASAAGWVKDGTNPTNKWTLLADQAVALADNAPKAIVATTRTVLTMTDTTNREPDQIRQDADRKLGWLLNWQWLSWQNVGDVLAASRKT